MNKDQTPSLDLEFISTVDNDGGKVKKLILILLVLFLLKNFL